ncbi:MAG: sulfite exporter TauE/SafE family protein [Acidobacteriia bacterium]|nr:sulfite exporter TauE/SafE family protein [Terriglobia bacterium]
MIPGVLSQPWQLSFILLAAFAAGMVNSVAGGGTLLSFPTLVWAGRDPLLANATNTIALWPGSLGGLWGYRREVTGSGRFAAALLGPSVLGGILGAVLLLRTPSRTFAGLVPWLILLATALLALQEPASRLVVRLGADRRSPAWWAGAVAFQFLVGVYGGYFGAGIGILMLAALGLLGLTDIHQMNGLKNFLAFSINATAAVYFVASGAVLWSDGLPMAASAVCGGVAGAAIARKVGRRAVRRVVVTIGLLMAISLFLRGI